MSRIKLILVGLLTMTMFSTVASGSALAGTVDLKVNGKTAVTATGTLNGTKKAGTPSELTVEKGPTIVCEGASIVSANSTLEGNASKDEVRSPGLEIDFATNCKVKNNAAEEADCKVKEPIAVVAETESATLSGTTANITFIQKGTTPFTKVTISQVSGKPTCNFVVSGAEVTGKQKCTTPEATTERVKQTLKCEKSGSELKFAGKKAEFLVTAEYGISAITVGTENLKEPPFAIESS